MERDEKYKAVPLPYVITDEDYKFIGECLVSMGVVSIAPETVEETRTIIKYLTVEQIRELWLKARPKIWKYRRGDFVKSIRVRPGSYVRWKIGKGSWGVSESVRNFLLYGIQIIQEVTLTTPTKLYTAIAETRPMVVMLDIENSFHALLPIIEMSNGHPVHIVCVATVANRTSISLLTPAKNVSFIMCEELKECVDHAITATGVLIAPIITDLVIITYDRSRFANKFAINSVVESCDITLFDAWDPRFVYDFRAFLKSKFEGKK